MGVHLETESRAAMARCRSPLGSRAEVARYLDVPVSTLNYWALKKIGPPFIKVGRVARYDWALLDGWLAERTADTAGGVG